MANLFGSFDENIRLLEQELSVRVTNRDGGAEGGRGGRAGLPGRPRPPPPLPSAPGRAFNKKTPPPPSTPPPGLGLPIKAKTLGQKAYGGRHPEQYGHPGHGPAGTGKTYLAVATAVAAFRAKEVNRIILTRPAVEAGGAAGLPARRPAEQGGPLSAPPLRRPV